MDEAIGGFPTLGVVTPVSVFLALGPPEQAVAVRPAQQQSRTAIPARAGPVRGVRPWVLIALAAPVVLLVIPGVPLTVRRAAVRPAGWGARWGGGGGGGRGVPRRWSAPGRRRGRPPPPRPGWCRSARRACPGSC